MDELLVVLSKLTNLPAWLLNWLTLLAVILFILDKFGLLKFLMRQYGSRVAFVRKMQADEQESRQEERKAKIVTEAAGFLQQPYNSAWLMEQVASNASHSLEQLAILTNFLQEKVDNKLDMSLENAITLKELRGEIRNVADALRGDIRTVLSEIDVVNRHLTDLDARMRKDG